MTDFEKITASPEALGEFLAVLPIATGPWDEQFHRAFCDACIDSNGTRNCDTPGCPHQDKRNIRPCRELSSTQTGVPKYTSGAYRAAVEQYGIRQSMNSELFCDHLDLERLTVEELKSMIWRYFMSCWCRRICSAVLRTGIQL